MLCNGDNENVFLHYTGWVGFILIALWMILLYSFTNSGSVSVYTFFNIADILL